MYRAIGVEPTKLTAAMSGWSSSRVNGLLVAVQDGEDAVGQAGLLPQVGEEQRRGRVLLARLEDERVAAGDRVRAHPQRHHGREVERRDAGDDPERLPDVVDVDVGGGLLGEPTLEQLRDAGGELDVLEAAGDLAERVGVHLAVLGRDDVRQLVGTLAQLLPELEQDVARASTTRWSATRRRPPSPSGRRRRPRRRWPGRPRRPLRRWRGCGPATCVLRCRAGAGRRPSERCAVTCLREYFRAGAVSSAR